MDPIGEMSQTSKVPSDFDYTALSTFLTCRRKYWFRIIRGIIPTAPPTAAEFGRCIHIALDEWFTSHDLTKAKEVFSANWNEAIADEKRNLRVAMKMLELYAEKYSSEGFKVLEVEKVFRVPMADFFLIGRIDKVIEWDGAVMVMDHKTTSRLGYEYFFKIKPNMQFDGYIYAAKQAGYTECNSILMDVLLVAKGLLVPAQLSKLTPLGRDISTRTSDDLLEYMVDITSIVDDIKREYEFDTWPRNTESCCDFVQCPYRGICSQDASVRESIIASDFKIEPWNPAKEIETI